MFITPAQRLLRGIALLDGHDFRGSMGYQGLMLRALGALLTANSKNSRVDGPAKGCMRFKTRPQGI